MPSILAKGDILSNFLQFLAAPLSGDDPFGADVNHDSDYERLKSEMGKLGDIDIGVVEALSKKILAGKSKDARVMAFLAYAALRKGDFGGLADVFCALADYCRSDFERVYPRREGAKLAALRWFSEARFSGCCAKADPQALDAPHIARLEAALSKLRTALEARFSDSAPPLSPLYKRVLEWKKAAASGLADIGNGGLVGAPLAGAHNDSNINGLTHKSDRLNDAEKSVNVDKSQNKVVIEMDHYQYVEIYQCIKKLKELLDEFA
jgi:type VI secretion system protein VasJ